MTALVLPRGQSGENVVCPLLRVLAVIERIRSATNGNVVLGGKRFEEQIAKMLKRRVTRGKAGRPKRTSDQTAQQTPV